VNLLIVHRERDAARLRPIFGDQWLIIPAMGVLMGHRFDAIVVSVRPSDFESVVERGAFDSWMDHVRCKFSGPAKEIVWMW